MKSGTLLHVGMALMLCGMLLGCGNLSAPVDTYGFKNAFADKSEPQAGSEPIGEASTKLAHDVLKELNDRNLDAARTKLESLRKQDDLSPRQRLEAKALLTVIEEMLGGQSPSGDEQRTVSTAVRPAG